MPRTIIAAVDDMFFVAKIRATAEHLGVELKSVRNAELLLNLAREGVCRSDNRRLASAETRSLSGRQISEG